MHESVEFILWGIGTVIWLIPVIFVLVLLGFIQIDKGEDD